MRAFAEPAMLAQNAVACPLCGTMPAAESPDYCGFVTMRGSCKRAAGSHVLHGNARSED